MTLLDLTQSTDSTVAEVAQRVQGMAEFKRRSGLRSIRWGAVDRSDNRMAHACDLVAEAL
jgi:hypothetical protein